MIVWIRANCFGMLEARVRIELTHKGFADLSLTTWVPRPLGAVASGQWLVASKFRR